ncbi:MAG: glycosyltransferase [Isosphaeraceae bacterium]
MPTTLVTYSWEQSLENETLEVSVVMPCLNEVRTVGKCVEKASNSLLQLGVRGEVVVADNGSTDGSQEIARSFGARVVPAVQRGYGSALMAGIGAARGRYIIMGDADDSYDFTRLGPFLDRLRAGFDLVMGNRFRGGIMPGAMPWHHRYIGNPILTSVLNILYRTPIGDAHCGLRAFRKDAYERLKLMCTGMEFASEMVIKSRLSGQKITEVPTTLQPDGRDRPPHLRSFRDGWRHLRLLLILCPLWLYLLPAGLMMALGALLMVWLTPGPRNVGGIVLDVHTMLIGSLALILGYQTVWLWAFSKIHGWLSGLLPEETFTTEVFRHLNLERGLVVGAAILFSGLAMIGWLVGYWSSRGFAPLDMQVTLRYTLWGSTAVVLGAQTIYGSFFLSMLGMTREARFPMKEER